MLEGLRANSGPVHVVSDSTYVVNCFRDRWYEGWRKRGWLNAAKKPVANRDLWEPLVELYEQRRPDVTFEWVKGHSGDRMNDAVDRLAVAAALTQEGQSGEQLLPEAEELGPADLPGGRDARLPAGPDGARRRASADRAGGYDESNAVAAGVRRRLTEILAPSARCTPTSGC